MEGKIKEEMAVIQRQLLDVEIPTLIQDPTPEFLLERLSDLRQVSITMSDLFSRASVVQRLASFMLSSTSKKIEQEIRTAFISNPRVRVGTSVEEKKMRAMEVAREMGLLDKEDAAQVLDEEARQVLMLVKEKYSEVEKCREDLNLASRLIRVRSYLEL